MFKSINQWSFPGSVTPKDALLYAKKTGYVGFEPSFDQTDCDSASVASEKAKLLKSLAANEGIRLTSLASGLYWSHNLGDEDSSRREKAQEVLRRQLDMAAELGVGAILVVPGTVGAGFWGKSEGNYETIYENSLSSIRALAEHARETGVVIALENVWNNFLLTPLEFRAFVDACGSPFVKAYFDVGNVVRTGDPVHWIEALGSRIERVHVKDFRRSVDTINGFVGLLEGNVGYPRVIPALRAVGYDGPLTAEMTPCDDDPVYIAEQTSLALTRILAM